MTTPISASELDRLERLFNDYVRLVSTATELTPEAAEVAREWPRELRNNLPALLAAARRLAELEGAAEYVRERSIAASGRYHSDSLDALLEHARGLGWVKP